MRDKDTYVAFLKKAVRDFVCIRDWEKFHTPKDLAESICIEAAELLQLFQWTKPEDSKDVKGDSGRVQRIKEELADVVLYCLSMANSLDLDLSSAVLNKIEQNKKKYPAKLYRGKAYINRHKTQ